MPYFDARLFYYCSPSPFIARPIFCHFAFHAHAATMSPFAIDRPFHPSFLPFFSFMPARFSLAFHLKLFSIRHFDFPFMLSPISMPFIACLIFAMLSRAPFCPFTNFFAPRSTIERAAMPPRAKARERRYAFARYCRHARRRHAARQPPLSPAPPELKPPPPRRRRRGASAAADADAQLSPAAEAPCVPPAFEIDFHALLPRSPRIPCRKRHCHHFRR